MACVGRTPPNPSKTRRMSTFSLPELVYERTGLALVKLVIPNDAVAGEIVAAEESITGDSETPKAVETVQSGVVSRVQHPVIEYLPQEKYLNEPLNDPAVEDLVLAGQFSSEADIPVGQGILTGSPAPLEDKICTSDEKEHGQDVSAEKVSIAEKDVCTGRRRLEVPVGTSEEQVNIGSITLSRNSEDTTQAAALHKATSFLGVPIDIRRVIYDQLIPVAKSIHLTHNPETTVFQCSRPARHRLSQEALNLFVSCRPIYDELVRVLYGTNTFIIMPGEQNYNSTMMPYPHSTNNLWLSHLRLTTRQNVKRFRVFLGSSVQADVEKIANGLTGFPEVEITVQPPSAFKMPIRLRQRAILERICREIHEARVNAGRTIWHDGGSSEVALMLANSLPSGFETL